MIKSLAMEFWKIRRRKVWTIVAALLFMQILWLLWGVNRMDVHELSQGWMFFLYKFPLLNAIMVPVIAAITASRLCDIEHKGQMLKLLHTLMPAGCLFTAKFLCGALYMLAVVLLQITVMVIAGLALGFAGNPPLDKLLYYLLFTMTVSITILLLQQVLSLLFRNQMMPLAVGVIGSFAGLFSMFFPPGLGKFILWGYYGVLMFVRMDWDRVTRITDYYYVPVDWSGFGILAVTFCLLYLLGRALFIRKDV